MAGSYRERGNSYELKYTYKEKTNYKTIKLSKAMNIYTELQRFVIAIEDKVSPTSSINFTVYAQNGWMNMLIQNYLPKQYKVTRNN